MKKSKNELKFFYEFLENPILRIHCFNLIPAGVLENQDMLGGVNLTPPLNPMFYVQI